MTDAAAAERIRQTVRELTRHPKMQGRHFGDDSALELLYQLEKFLREREIHWPKPEQEQG